MTNMEKVAEMLGVKFGEKFNIKDYEYNPYEITRNGLVDKDCDLVGDELVELLNGELTIEKINQEPKSAKVTVISDICGFCGDETSLGFIRIIEDCKIKVICEDCLEERYDIKL